jgi:hypothetical protein
MAAKRTDSKKKFEILGRGQFSRSAMILREARVTPGKICTEDVFGQQRVSGQNTWESSKRSELSIAFLTTHKPQQGPALR